MEAEEYVPLPKGDVHKKKEIIQDLTLHDLDLANAKPQVQYSIKITVIKLMRLLGRSRHYVYDGTNDETQED